jgi:hypothetical protein
MKQIFQLFASKRLRRAFSEWLVLQAVFKSSLSGVRCLEFSLVTA